MLQTPSDHVSFGFAGGLVFFDFLDRDLRTYLPVLSSTKIGKIDRFLKLGRFRIPLQKPSITLLRKSKPFWTILGEHNVWSTVLRVPITFPPDKFYGAQLAAMSVPRFQRKVQRGWNPRGAFREW
jgi:hypothetical protein